MKLLWLDLETTDLDPKVGGILEIGAIVSDGEKLLGHFHRRVSQPPEVLARMHPFCAEMHEKNGLLKEIKRDAMPWGLVAFDFAEFLRQNFNFEKDKPRLAGYSVHFDKKWLEEHSPELAAILHHRVLDISTLRDTMKDMGLEFEEPKAHRAIADCEDAMRAYSNFRKVLAVGVAAWRLVR